MIHELLVKCPRCGREWYHVFGDGNPICTPCIRNAARKPQNGRRAKEGSK